MLRTSLSRQSLAALAIVATGGLASLPCTAGAQGRVTPAGAAGTSEFDFRGDFAGPLGLQLYSVRGPIRGDVPRTLARVRALGFREVELAGTYGLSARQFRQALDRAGLRATSMHVGYDRLRDSLPAVLADARTLGVRYVGTAWIPHTGGPLTEEGARRAAADFDRWGRAARAQGLQFFYHIHGYEFQPGPSGVLPLDVLMRETDPEAVKFQMDVFWATRPGADPAALLRKYPTRWRLMHLKDMKQGTATNVHTGSAPPDETEVPVGSGQIDYRAVLRAAREVGVEQYYVEDETADPFATIPQSTRWLQAVRFAQGAYGAQGGQPPAGRPEDTEAWTPVPKVVAPGATSGAAPADAIVLFDGRDLDQWVSTNDGSPARWTVSQGVMTVNKPAGNIETKRRFRDYQLHLEWRIPEGVTGSGQARGNSGLFLASTGPGDAGYELQIVDSYANTTYVNGQAGAVYKQYPPLVNASRPPGEWQTYDVLWTAPRFRADGSLESPAYVTAFHNGVLIQDHVALTGETVYIGPPSYKPHGPAPIKLQAHGDPSPPISFRNIWVRER